MKYSVALVPVLAAASLAGFIETRQDKKPFVERPDDDFWLKQCKNGPNPSSSELCRGTHAYCSERWYRKEREPFGSVQDCFRSRATPAFREPAPTELKEYMCESGRSRADTWRKTSEACLGTNEYCNQRIYEKDGEPFDSPEACVDSRKVAKSGANPEVSKGGDIRQDVAKFCAENQLGLSSAACNIQVAQCTSGNKDAISFDVIAKCVESRTNLL